MSGAICNFVTARDGVRVCAVCEWCGRRSRPVSANYRGEPDLFELPRGWWEAPYGLDWVHADGSAGSLWTCPTCGKCRVGLTPHPTRVAARKARAAATG